MATDPFARTSRTTELTIGVILAFFGIAFTAIAVLVGVMPLDPGDRRRDNLLVMGILLVFGLPAVLYAARLLFPRLRAVHGGIVGPLGLEIAGVCLLVMPVVAILGRHCEHLLIHSLLVGSAGACFALARLRRRAQPIPQPDQRAATTPE